MNAPANISQPVEFSLPIKNYNEFYRFYPNSRKTSGFSPRI
ncbi:hypothetical protein F972_00514 [Acinetobacter sp. CIP 102529]|uniref:Uncharacterized protein n=1 Tax=Acinetobacter parvus DSM 16617 = CIP 108168 TaxID=981333 RepID=N8RTJ5_9GAMM|nr:hypothetical protein F988_00918 [Acinetobacter parvus DSM 16617 = CIP 108168]ENU90136.1 hypothetical protein F972_00514 [Acinetobacter sp. CIP 102529]